MQTPPPGVAVHVSVQSIFMFMSLHFFFIEFVCSQLPRLPESDKTLRMLCEWSCRLHEWLTLTGNFALMRQSNIHTDYITFPFEFNFSGTFSNRERVKAAWQKWSLLMNAAVYITPHVSLRINTHNLIAVFSSRDFHLVVYGAVNASNLQVH